MADNPNRPDEAGAQAAGAAPFTVVVTRPAGQSAALSAQLAKHGLRPFDFPLIGIEPVADEAPLRSALGALDRYALVVFVSPNAVERAFAAHASIWPHALPVAVVGPASVAALAQHGVAAPAHRVISPASAAASDGEPRFDSESLYAALTAELGAGALDGRRVLVVRGDGGREWLADRLREVGAEVEIVAAYRRVVPEPSIGAWAQVHALLAGAPHAWLVTSSEGVRNLDELAREHLTADEIARLRRAPLVAPHPRIAETARGLGFDRMTVSGAGDDRIARALVGLASSAVPPAPDTPAHHPAHSRMTDSNNPSQASAQTAAPTRPQPAASPASYGSRAAGQQARRSVSGPLLWLVVIVLAAAAGTGGYALNRKVERMDARLAQRQQANDAQVAELRATTGEAVASVHQMDTQIEQLEGKLADAQNAQQALAQQYADLARNRDDWTLAEVGQMLSSASEQLALTGNTQLALFALQSADARLAASGSPQALAVRKAIAQDMDRLKAAPSTDLAGLAIKLDTAIGQVDSLPLAGEALVSRTKPAATAPSGIAKTAAASGEPRWQVWAREFAAGIGAQLASLVEVRRIDHPDAMLVSPDEGYFLRENLKLRLLSARLSLLSRNDATLKADLDAADDALARYFDNASGETRAVRDLVKQVEAGSATEAAPPNLNASLQAIQQYRSRG
ncbi:fused uroporphyrinogen-III synthase HemD/membrane protein HemX [Burkholderia sp. WAC0059]|uniref:fused uroporphyrinogen-III synthase HemD/membrane protein HemX n=1 Tax=Burkholderia sp. WAC0059 TaxID=2066022 RepID=UPI000C7F45C4|nr:fused uroporphyrinogen-III synthase HemD/membrane protein HemX [Burkholderia sp. WAC0059]PLZ00255.1 fused uroporphyrinogen-III synthase HemD/membrane protein HemX [Burkholderia sp. WAC0059]